MFDWIYYLLPTDLFSQATYFNGILYLPAYQLAKELLAVSLPLALAILILGILVLKGIAKFIRWVIRFLLR